MRNTPDQKGHTYRIAHSGSDGRIPRFVEFEARDAASALLEAGHLAPAECPVRILEDGRELAVLERALEGFWAVSRTVSGSEVPGK